MNEAYKKTEKAGQSTIADFLSYGVLALASAWVLLTFGDYGLGWDDPIQAYYGDLIVSHIASLGEDVRVFSLLNLNLYGGLFEAPVQFLAKLLDRTLAFPEVDTRHLAGGLVGVLGLLGVWRMACFLGGPVAGLVALLLLALTPNFMGHAFINTKDIPFAVGTIWTLYFAARAAEALPRVSWCSVAWLGVALGMTMGVRIGGVVLLAYMGALMTVNLAWVSARPKLEMADVRHLAAVVAMVLLVAFVFTFALWPGAWQDPFGTAFVSLIETARFSYTLDVLFMGETFHSTSLPWYYLPVHLWAKLPPVFLGAFAIAVPLAVAGFGRAFVAGNRKVLFGYAALGLGVFFPPIFAIVSHSAHYDAIRHFLFVLPPMAVLAGIELARLGCWLQRRNHTLAVMAAMVLAVGLGEAAWATARLHPYSYVYYSPLAGGLKGAEGHYELDYWATSYREAAGELARFAEDQPVPKGGRFRVAVCGPEDVAMAFLPPSFEAVQYPKDADFFIGIARWSCDDAIEAPVIAEIGRHGVRLSVVRDLRGGFTEAQPYRGRVKLDRL